MARTKQEIKSSITTPFIQNAHIIAYYGLDENLTFDQQFSIVSIENIIFNIITNIVFFLELLFGEHESRVDTKLHEQKNCRLPWYRTMALAFQYGFDLVQDKDYFDNSNATEEQIEQSKIIKYAAVTEPETPATVILKIAGETGGELAPLTEPQRDAFIAYVKEFKPPGLDVNVINYLPDLLYIDLTIYRDALVLDENGMSILNGNYPVNDAINEFMKELPFNGEFTRQSFVDKLQLVKGVRIAHINNIESAWIDPNVNDYGAPISIPVKKIAESGYFKVANFDNIAYVV